MTDIAKTWADISTLLDEEYVRLRVQAEKNLCMRGSDNHQWGIIRMEMMRIWEEEHGDDNL